MGNVLLAIKWALFALSQGDEEWAVSELKQAIQWMEQEGVTNDLWALGPVKGSATQEGGVER